MAITPPAPQTNIDATTWGKPITDEVNRLTTVTDTQTANLARMGGSWRRAANQTIPATTWTTVSFDTELADTNAFLAPPATTITMPAGTAGVYAISLAAYTGLNATVRLMVTGVSDNITAVPDPITGACALALTMALAVGNTIYAQIYAGGATYTVARLELWKVSN
jgi:hypothetical protein